MATATRNELIQMLTLNSMADDYESFDHLCEWAVKSGAQCGLTIERSEVLNALLNLIETRLAQAYRFSRPTNSFIEIQGTPPLEEISNPWYRYFWITRNGVEVLSAKDEGWPFDDECELRKDWVPPEN
jgi:hypothetical protein